MDLGLKGKVALVTGASGGIGFATAQALTDEGAVVYINGRSREKVEAAVAKVKGGRSAVFDLEKKGAAGELVKAIPAVDILVNNLGIFEARAFEEIRDEDWERIFNINVFTGIRLSRHYLPLMKKKNWGRIVFISSESGIQIPIEMIHYGVTKATQLAVSRGLAELTAGTRVTVNSVLPGPTMSTGVEKFVSEVAESRGISAEQVMKEYFESVRPTSLLKRFATAEEVGAFVAFVCSERASAVNGASLRVDGGVVRTIV